MSHRLGAVGDALLRKEAEYDAKKRLEATTQGQSLFDAVKKIMAGQAPPTSDLDGAISKLDVMLGEESKTLTDPAAKNVMADIRELLSATKTLLLRKNPDDAFQKLLINSVFATTKLSSSVKKEVVEGASKNAWDKSQNEWKQIQDSARSVILMLAKSPQFRDSMSTLLAVARRLLGKKEIRQSLIQEVKSATQSVKSDVSGAGASMSSAPSQQAPRQPTLPPSSMPSSIPSGPGKIVETAEVRMKPETVPFGYAAGASMAPGASHIVPTNVGRTASTAIPIQEFEEYSEEEYSDEEEDTEELVPPVQSEHIQGAGAAAATETAVKSGAERYTTAAKNVTGKVMENVDEETRRKLQQNVFDMLRMLAAEPGSRQTIDSMFNLAKYASAASAASTMQAPAELNQAREQGTKLVEAFIGGGNLTLMFTHLNSLVSDIRKDPETLRLLRKIRKYVDRTLDDPELLDQQFHRQKAIQLLDGFGTLGERYRDHQALGALLTDWQNIIDKISTDLELRAFAVAFGKLSQDIMEPDDKGGRRLNMTALNQIRAQLLPVFLEQLHYIPIPEQTGTSDKMDYKFSNILLSVFDLLPEHIFVDLLMHTDFKPLSDVQHEQVDKSIYRNMTGDNESRPYRRFHKYGYLAPHPETRNPAKRLKRLFAPKERIAPSATSISSSTPAMAVQDSTGHYMSSGQMVIRVYNIHIAMKDVVFELHRKVFPKMSVLGKVDIHSKGLTGSKVVIRLDSRSSEYPNIFSGGSVDVVLAPLAIRIHDSNHNFLSNFLVKLASRTIKRMIEVKIAEQINAGLRTTIERVNGLVAQSPAVAGTVRKVLGQGSSKLKGPLSSLISGAKNLVSGASEAVGGEVSSAH
jgi:hypothetical protein